jgi:hypothetical protein
LTIDDPACVEPPPPPPATAFSLFPSEYFVDGYRESYSLTGSDTDGVTFTGDWTFQAGAQTTFNGSPAIPFDGILNITNTATNAFFTSVETDYYSTNANDRRDLGFASTSTGVVKTPTSTTALPTTARIGDFGNIGTYVTSSGDTDVETWQLTDAGNGRAYILFFISRSDQFGDFNSSREEKYLIDENGNRMSLELRIFFQSSGITLTLTGTKQ